MSPFRSSAGPATVRMPTPSSSRTICASVVLPRPGGPTSRTWSSASPRAFAAVERDRELLLDALLADEVGEPARAERALERLLLGREDRGGSRAAHAACPQREPDALLGGQLGIDLREHLLGLEHRVAELDERVAGGEGLAGAGASADGRSPCRACPSAPARSAPRSSCRCRGSPGSARRPRARSRVADRRRPSPRRSRARPSARRRSR